MTSNKTVSEWIYYPNTQRVGDDGLIDSLSNDLLQSVLTVVQDGICILDRNFNIVYVNPTLLCWYPDYSGEKGHKCYEVYHNRDSQCENCPVIKAIESKCPTSGVVPFEVSDRRETGWQQLFCVPILDSSNEVVLAIEYIRDITRWKHVQLSSDLVESQNKLLLNYLEENQKEKETMARTIAVNVDRCIQPVLNYLENLVSEEAMGVIRRQLDFSVQSLTRQKSHLADRLSPRELEIAMLIKDNYLSKEIADRLTITKKAVDFHRTGIRKKLNLDSKDNLQRFLEINL